MKFKDYLEEHRKLLEPIEEIPVKIAVLGVVESILEEYRGEFSNKIIPLIEEERKRLLDTEITAKTGSEGGK